ncbi:MAG: D-glycero-beta-D-manno-heptose 1-phosphate adenylyltransferase [Planctomycetes bacterium]|nr:D-glycero-beta-D-manno-heptose 1-phosphate adenylyltransferase [Planctomycetota bacterium]
MSRSAAEVLAALRAPRVVVVGDLILDRYITGLVERISPEAPIQVLAVEHDERRLGGAGSVANDLAVLGARARLVGLLGDDDSGAEVRRQCEAAGIDLVAVTCERPTSLKTRHLARSHSTAQQVLRVDREVTTPVEGALERRVLAALDAAFADADVVLLSDYQKGLLTPAVVAHAVAWGRRAGRPVVVDPKADDFDRYRGATGIKPNRAQTARIVGRPVRDAADAARACEEVAARYGFDFVLVTLDRDGMVLAERGAAAHAFRTEPREVFDVTGAGDMVLAVVGLALGSGASLPEAASLANVAASLEVEKVGSVPISRAELAARLSEGAPVLGSKVVERPKAAALARRLREAGRRVVFTNGCFDVLHAGHVRYLNFARAQGDVLVVGLNADESVRRLKGDGRPVNPAADRAEVLSGLAAVDHVVVFHEDTPLALIGEVLPDVLVKGEDWKDKGVVGREVVEARGGTVVLAPLLAGRSTTATIARIRAADASCEDV